MNRLRGLLLATSCLLLPVLCLAERGTAPAEANSVVLTTEEKAWIAAHPVIRIAADPDYAPFQFTNERGQSVGLANDYLQLIARRLGLQFEYQLTDSWAESLQLIKDHKADMVAVATETPERLEYMRFTTPYVEFPDVIITRAGEPVASLENLHGNSLLTIKGFGINEHLRNHHPQIKLQMADSVKSLLAKISTGEADVGVLNLATTSYAIEKWKIANLAISSSTDFSYALALASRRDWPMLHHLLQKGIDAISEDEKQAIARHWVGLQPGPWEPSQEQYVAFAVGLIVLGFAITLIWNRQLRMTVESRTEELRASEQEFRNLYKTALVGLFRTTIDGRRVLEANPALAHQFGYESVEQFIDEFSARDAYVEPGKREQLLKSVRQGRVDNFEFLGRMRDGSVRHFMLSGTLYEEKGYLEGALLDITDRKRAENEARAARETAERANRAKTDFLAAASHDLRQPLHAISLQIGQLQEMLENEEAARILSQISSSQFVLSDILNALLDISHLDAGTIKANLSHVPLAQLFNRIEGEFRPLASERNVKLRFHPTHAWLYTDGILLYRILANLVDNAIKHSGNASVLIGARRRGDHWRIEIRDSGPGIAVEQQQIIFDEFVQLDNPGRDRRNGLGLGLSIVQRLSRLLNLPLDLISRPDYGSCFRLLVPEGLPAPQQSDDTAGGQEERHFSLRGAVVLVVDDDPDVLEATRELLLRWQCGVLTARSMKQALGVTEEEEIDMIIADYHLSDGHTGVEVIEALKTRGHHRTKAVIITGNANPQDLPGLANSHYPVLNKPVAAVTLRSTLHRLRVG